MMTTTSTTDRRMDKMITGQVCRGTGRGRTLGFPTANLDTAVPADALRGLFAAWTWLDGAWQPGVLYVGTRPTFGGRDLQAEVHLLDNTAQDLYGRTLHVLPVRYLTEERRFSNTGALALHLHHMCTRAQAVLGQASEELPRPDTAVGPTALTPQ